MNKDQKLSKSKRVLNGSPFMVHLLSGYPSACKAVPAAIAAVLVSVSSVGHSIRTDRELSSIVRQSSAPHLCRRHGSLKSPPIGTSIRLASRRTNRCVCNTRHDGRRAVARLVCQRSHRNGRNSPTKHIFLSRFLCNAKNEKKIWQTMRNRFT